MNEQRVAKLMAVRGLCSRREAERLIEQGCVRVNGVVVRVQGFKAPLDAEIAIDAGATAALAGKLTVLLHKPLGVVSAQPERGQTPALQFVTAPRAAAGTAPSLAARVATAAAHLAVAGRLDRASRGLLILTEDGTVARRIIGGNGVEKEYVVRTDPAATDGQIRKLRGQLELDGKSLLPMRVHRLAEDLLRFVLREGRKHQIRRLCRRFGIEVVDLFRVAVGPFALGDLPEGRWRPARPDELERLRTDGRVAAPKTSRIA